MKKNPMQTLLENRSSAREKGVYSCCSANEYVIRAALRRGLENDTVVLVEATANQVNQNGGYTGMTPARFYEFLHKIAVEEGFPEEKLLCGGDHLGPLTWKHLPEEQAMANARELVRGYVLAGFSKIHIDTSMRVADDDPNTRLSDATIARRGAELCAVAEEAFREYRVRYPDAPAPVYVIGSEVPVPGGAEENEDSVAVTTPADCAATVEAFRNAFAAQGLTDAWKRVIAVVVQPGVEFADESVIEYDRAAAAALTDSLKALDGVVFEGHSTDYQTPDGLKQMVEDGIAILKVGPALTFALREGLFALEMIERELAQQKDLVLSDFRKVLEQTMLNKPGYWEKYYHGDESQQHYKRAFSFSDRCRYYLAEPDVMQAVAQLLRNLDQEDLPLALISQYLPRQYSRVRGGKLRSRGTELLIDRVGDCIDEYLYAVL